MGSGAGFVVVFFLVVYLGPAAWFCRKVAAKSSQRIGWLMAAGLLGLPVALVFAGLFVR